MSKRYTVAVQMQLIEIDGPHSTQVKSDTFALDCATIHDGHERFDEIHQMMSEYIYTEYGEDP